MQINKVTENEIKLEKQQMMLENENAQLRADLDYVSAMADIPLEVAE